MKAENLIFLFVIATLINVSYSVPTAKASNDSSADTNDTRNLRYTFGENEEIPAGFFDMKPESVKNSREERQAFAACQDGSGGFCIPLGQCKQEDKPITRNSRACGAGEECCYSLPDSKTSCRNRGGECVRPPRDCSPGTPAIRITSGTECNHANGEKCCIWVY